MSKYMKCFFTCISMLYFISSCAQHNSIPFDKLAGTWTMQTKNGAILGETWIVETTNRMSGKSFLIKNGDTTLLETVSLIKEGDDIFYIPVAYGQNQNKPVAFKLSSVQNNVFTFENLAHDFPKRIVYDFNGHNTLHAFIDDGTENKRQHFHYIKQ